MQPNKTAEDVKKILSEESQTSGIAQKESVYLDDEVGKQIKLEYLQTLKQNNIERKKYAWYIFLFTCCWAIAIIIIIIFNGFSLNCFNISDSVLITLITTTTVNFFGFFLLVTKYLFNPKAIEKANPFN